MKISYHKEQASADFWDGHWASESPQNANSFARFTKQFSIMKKYTDPLSPALEGGCGLGQWVWLMHHLGQPVVGIDFAQKTVERIKALAPELDIRSGNVFSLEFPDNYFGTYYSWGVAEHFPEGPQTLIAEAFRILKPGGRLLISVPYYNPRRRGLYPDGAQIGQGEFYQYAFDASEFSRALREAGFVIERDYKLNWIKGFREKKRAPSANPTAAKPVSATSTSDLREEGRFKRLLKTLVVWASDLWPLTERWGHMILFVARKP